MTNAKQIDCETELRPNTIDAETFKREVALCKKLSNKNDGGCCWGRCMDCGVLPLLVKLHKGEVIDNKEKIDALKQDILL